MFEKYLKRKKGREESKGGKGKGQKKGRKRENEFCIHIFFRIQSLLFSIRHDNFHKCPLPTIIIIL